MTKPVLPQEGGAYTLTKKGDLQKVQGTAPKTAPATPAPPEAADEEKS